MANELSGQEITTVQTNYENVTVNDAEGNQYYISPETLGIILNEFDFVKNKKKTRTWLEIDIEKWRVENFNQERAY